MNHQDLESNIAEWKSYLAQRAVISDANINELEDHLRDQIDRLRSAGLDDSEAFLIAAKRIGNLDAVSREFALSHSGRLWKNLVLASHPTESESSGLASEFLVVLCLAIAAAAAIKIPAAFGMDIELQPLFYLRNMTFFCFPLLAAYFVWKRQLKWFSLRLLAPPFLISLLIVNLYPYTAQGSSEILSILHLPIALWLIVGLTYTGDWWRSETRRMDFVRFSGEIVIYYVLIALGGGILTGFTILLFSLIGINLENFAVRWIIPCGAMGAVIIAAWLVEAKQAAIENMAPVLTRVFTPLFTLLLLAFLLTMLLTGSGIDVQREVLIALDLLLALVLGLVLYAVSSRDADTGPNWFDRMQFVLVLSALLVDALALIAITGRISELGFTPNRVAALGENLVLLVSLSGYAWYYFLFMRAECGFASLERWQTHYIPVYAIWAAIVVVVFPPVFGFI